MRQWGRGIFPPSNLVEGCGRAETLALPMEAATRNAAQAPNPVPCQRRGRVLGSSFPPHTNPQFGLSTAGIGRARNRNPGPCPCPVPSLHIPNSRLRCLCPQGDISNALPSEAFPRLPSLESITSSLSLLSLAMKLTQINSTLLLSHDIIINITIYA